MLVYFLRHAEAEPDAESDFARRLTAKGTRQAERVGKFLSRHEIAVDLILTSPVVRARQTAKLVAPLLPQADLIEVGWLACGMTPEDCRQGLLPFTDKESVLLVGHEPDFSETIAALLGMEDAQAIEIRKASLTAVALHPTWNSLQFTLPCRLMDTL